MMGELLLGCFLINNIAAAIAIPLIIRSIRVRKMYEASAYYKITHCPFNKMRSNTGRYGEYLIYKELLSLEKTDSRFLFNLYIPKGNGETTEIDVLMICEEGVFVFESKNYSGWIYGNENQKYWTQTLRSSHSGIQKNHFYNPIWQTRSHVRYLNALLGGSIPIYSSVVFSPRCVIKKIALANTDVSICNRQFVFQYVNDMRNAHKRISSMPISVKRIYDYLYPYSQVSEEEKQRHIMQTKAHL